MIVLQASDVRTALPMDETIAAMKQAFAALSDGRAQVPLRTKVEVPAHAGESLFMPAFVDDAEGEALAVKVVAVFTRNAEQGLPTLHAAVLVLEASTGRPTALLEGGTLTAIRTGAASGAATDLLARPDSEVAAIFGAGVQAHGRNWKLYARYARFKRSGYTTLPKQKQKPLLPRWPDMAQSPLTYVRLTPGKRWLTQM